MQAPQPVEANMKLLRPAADVVAAYVGEEAVLWSQRDGMYYGLDEVSARLWRLSVEGVPLAAIHLQLLSEYEVDGASLWNDLSRISAELVALGLAAAVEDGGSVES